MNSTAPIRSRAAEEGSLQIPLWGVPFILILLYVCLFSGLGAIGLVGPDEPRYAAIARAMAETHDWVTPRLWGTPWFEKPVLYYWTAGIAMRIFGASEFSARLPSALAALLAVVAIKWTALRSYGLGAAWYSLLMLPTSVAMIGFSRAASPDMLFAGLLTAAMAVACEMLQKPRPGPILRVAFGFFLGAAVLAKGPAAVILAGGATLLWAALSRQWLAPFRFLHPLIIGVFCATALPWYVLCALRNPDFLRVFIWQHNFERYLTPLFEHRQPFWFFGAVFLAGILPWLAFLVVAFRGARRDQPDQTRNSPALFLGCWALFTVLFFSVSQSKLPGYILPAFPPAILLLARGLVRQTERKRKGTALLFISTAAVYPILIGVVGLKLLPTLGGGLTLFHPGPFGGVRAGSEAALIGGGVAVALALTRKWSCAFCAVATTAAILVLITNQMLLPGLDAAISARPLAVVLSQTYDVKPEEIAIYQLPRAYQFGLDYYFAKDLPEWTPENTNASVLLFSAGTDIQESSAFDYGPASRDGKIQWAWRKDRARRPVQRF